MISHFSGILRGQNRLHLFQRKRSIKDKVGKQRSQHSTEGRQGLGSASYSDDSGIQELAEIIQLDVSPSLSRSTGLQLEMLYPQGILCSNVCAILCILPHPRFWKIHRARYPTENSLGILKGPVVRSK